MSRIGKLLIIGLFIVIGCANSDQKDKDFKITIVNIGHSSRIEIGKQLRIINKYSPRIIGLDFYLVPDSLEQDTILVHELNVAKNTVQVVGLHDLYPPEDIWDSLEVSNSKFLVTSQGFANLTTLDKVLYKELPMEQHINDMSIYSFSYVVALNSFGLKNQFKVVDEIPFEFNLSGLGKNYKLINSEDLLSENFDKSSITDKIVLLGYIGEDEDVLYTDRFKITKVNGIEVHAALIEELIRD